MTRAAVIGILCGRSPVERYSTHRGYVVEGSRILGVQWHPERLSAIDPRHLAPFAWVARG
jgi:hypothetical protein